MRRVANQEALAKNINDMASEGTGKLVELADSNPARINEAQISWHDTTDGGNYTLDRKSGELTVVVASSTGGYFLHHRCKLEN